MNQVLVESLLEITIAGLRRGENGFKAEELSKVTHKVQECFHVDQVLISNVRARLKTHKKDYTDIMDLLKSGSGFGLDETGRVFVDPLVWETYLKYEKGQLVLCDVMEKVKDVILVSSLTRTTKTMVGRSPVIRAHAAPTALLEAKNRVTKRTKHVQGSGNDKNPTI